MPYEESVITRIRKALLSRLTSPGGPGVGKQSWIHLEGRSPITVGSGPQAAGSIHALSSFEGAARKSPRLKDG